MPDFSLTNAIECELFCQALQWFCLERKVSENSGVALSDRCCWILNSITGIDFDRPGPPAEMLQRVKGKLPPIMR